MRQYQKRKKLHMLIAILMSLNIFSVGYATWAITGPSTSEAGGSFQSYAVAYYTIAIDPSFQAIHNKNNAGYFIPNGDLASFKDPTESGASTSNAPANQAKLTLTYSLQSSNTATITTTVMFGDAASSKAFFATAKVFSIERENGTSLDYKYNEDTGVLSFTFEPKNNDVITINFSTSGNDPFAEGICNGTARGFVVRTMVQDGN